MENAIKERPEEVFKRFLSFSAKEGTKKIEVSCERQYLLPVVEEEVVTEERECSME
jgi:hypothetical protein